MLHRTVRFASLAVLVALSGCAAGITSPEASLGSARARWASAQPAAYQFIVTRSCECGPSITRPVTVVVRNGVIQSAKYVDTGADAVAEATYTVETLFGLIDDAIRRNAFDVTVRYDDALGFPVGISIDYSATVVDDEFTIYINRFQVL